MAKAMTPGIRASLDRRSVELRKQVRADVLSELLQHTMRVLVRVPIVRT